MQRLFGRQYPVIHFVIGQAAPIRQTGQAHGKATYSFRHMAKSRFFSPFVLGMIIATSTSAADRMPLLMPGDFESLQLVSWRVEQGVPDPHNPLLEPAMPWDSGGIMAHGTVLRDPIDGLWKAWQVSTPGEETLDGLKSNHESQRRLTYLESVDGVDWYRPMLGLGLLMFQSRMSVSSVPKISVCRFQFAGFSH